MLTITSPAATEVVSSAAWPPVIAYQIPFANLIPAQPQSIPMVELGGMATFNVGVVVPTTGEPDALYNFIYLNDEVVFDRLKKPIFPLFALICVKFVPAAEIAV
ncbi:MAG: hypothetical protein EBR82_42585 [Caulobacteraceae bacterium]|nr:hypothetical protein [Caulobacteraceae bacterium]